MYRALELYYFSYIKFNGDKYGSVWVYASQIESLHQLLPSAPLLARTGFAKF
jgi:hypothetical protein